MRQGFYLVVALLLSVCTGLSAQTVLTLDECRDRAVRASKELEQAGIEKEMAAYDRKIARANYFPNLGATGGYLYNQRDIALISDAQSALLTQSGDLLQSLLNGAAGDLAGTLNAAMSDKMTQLMTAIRTNPALAAEYMGSPLWQTVLGMLQGADAGALGSAVPDIAAPVNAIGADIDKALHPDLHNLWMGSINLTQPVFAGGKILYANRAAALAEELAAAKYDQAYADVIVDVDAAYWQIVSIAAKKRLAESYCDLLEKMLRDTEQTVKAGLATESDALQVSVKANEATLTRIKAANGLVLAKMLLCQRIGMPLDSDIELQDEAADFLPLPQLPREKTMEEIYADRPEIRSLMLAREIYDRKSKVARADMLPTVALTANYLVSNPNVFNGIRHTWNGGLFSAGVLVKVPIFHGGEASFRYHRAKAEIALCQSRLEDAREKIELQVSRQQKSLEEAFSKLDMARSGLDSAEENLRQADLGFAAGVAPVGVVLEAQTAWLGARSAYIDAGIELLTACDALRKAEGNYTEK